MISHCSVEEISSTSGSVVSAGASNMSGLNMYFGMPVISLIAFTRRTGTRRHWVMALGTMPSLLASSVGPITASTAAKGGSYAGMR